MLQQQINYWTLRETMRHNRVGEQINQQDADTNRMNANTNVFNSKINAINAVSNRMQAKASLSQAAAAHRMAGAQEIQAAQRVREMNFAEAKLSSEIFSNYARPFSSAFGNGTNILGTGLKGAKVPTSAASKLSKASTKARLATAIEAGAIGAGATAGIITAGVIGGAYALNSVYDYWTEPGKERQVITKWW